MKCQLLCMKAAQYNFNHTEKLADCDDQYDDEKRRLEQTMSPTGFSVFASSDVTVFDEPLFDAFQMTLRKLAIMELDAEHLQRIIEFRREQQGEERRIECDAIKYDDLKSNLQCNQSDAEYRNEFKHQCGLEGILQNMHGLPDISFVVLFELPDHRIFSPGVPHRVLSPDEVEEK